MDLLVLHAVRLKGFADSDVIARRFDLDPAAAHEELLDAQARGWVSRHSFADITGWSLSEAGRRQNESQLRAELDQIGARDEVNAAHAAFLPLNARAVEAFTAWQLAPTSRPPGGEVVGGLGDLARELDGLERKLSAREVMGGLRDLARELDGLELRLTACLRRFAGYHDRFVHALGRSIDDPALITNPDVDSCHTVWFELHEDLTSTLGIPRG